MGCRQMSMVRGESIRCVCGSWALNVAQALTKHCTLSAARRLGQRAGVTQLQGKNLSYPRGTAGACHALRCKSNRSKRTGGRQLLQLQHVKSNWGAFLQRVSHECHRTAGSHTSERRIILTPPTHLTRSPQAPTQNVSIWSRLRATISLATCAP